MVRFLGLPPRPNGILEDSKCTEKRSLAVDGNACRPFPVCPMPNHPPDASLAPLLWGEVEQVLGHGHVSEVREPIIVRHMVDVVDADRIKTVNHFPNHTVLLENFPENFDNGVPIVVDNPCCLAAVILVPCNPLPVSVVRDGSEEHPFLTFPPFQGTAGRVIRKQFQQEALRW